MGACRVRLERDARLDDEEPRSHGRPVELRPFPRRAHGGDMRPRREPLCAEHGLGGVRAGAHDVGAAHGVLERADRRAADLAGERFGALRAATGHADLVEVPHARGRLDVRARLNARSEHRQDARVGPRESLRRDRRGGPGADGCDLGAVHEGERLPGLVVEERDRRLVGRQIAVLGEDRHELRLEDSVRVPGHRREEPALRARGDPRRHGRPARAELDERALERLEQQLEVEQLAHLGPAQDEHG